MTSWIAAAYGLAMTGLEFCIACIALSVCAERANRAALATTSKELLAMPSPANQAGKSPATAKGTQAAL